MFELHDFRIIGVFYKSLLSKGPTDPFDLNDFLNYRSSDYIGSTVCAHRIAHKGQLVPIILHKGQLVPTISHKGPLVP